MLILNPLGGFLIIAAICCGYWYLMFPIIGLIVLNTKFYFYAHRDEPDLYNGLPWEEFKNTHTLIGYDYHCEYWKNDETNEIIEI